MKTDRVASSLGLQKKWWWAKRLGRTLRVLGALAAATATLVQSGPAASAQSDYDSRMSDLEAMSLEELLDGIPTNGVNFGSGQYATQNIQLGVLDRIEIIRGPGSAIYGSDAFHGVMAMSTFESDEDVTQVSAEGGVNHYYQAGLRHSVGFGSGSRLNLAFAASGEEQSATYHARDLNTGDQGKAADLNSEVLDSFEVVLLKRHDSWSAEIVLFENRWKDGIVLVVDPSFRNGFEYQNTGRNRARGVEASFSWHSQSWRVDFSGSYVKSRNLETDENYDLFPRVIASIGVARLFSNGAEIFLNNRIFAEAKDTASSFGPSTPEGLPVY